MKNETPNSFVCRNILKCPIGPKNCAFHKLNSIAFCLEDFCCYNCSSIHHTVIMGCTVCKEPPLILFVKKRLYSELNGAK